MTRAVRSWLVFGACNLVVVAALVRMSAVVVRLERSELTGSGGDRLPGVAAAGVVAHGLLAVVVPRSRGRAAERRRPAGLRVPAAALCGRLAWRRHLAGGCKERPPPSSGCRPYLRREALAGRGRSRRFPGGREAGSARSDPAPTVVDRGPAGEVEQRVRRPRRLHGAAAAGCGLGRAPGRRVARSAGSGGSGAGLRASRGDRRRGAIPGLRSRLAAAARAIAVRDPRSVPGGGPGARDRGGFAGRRAWTRVGQRPGRAPRAAPGRGRGAGDHRRACGARAWPGSP